MATDQEHRLSTFWSDIDTTYAAKYSPLGGSRGLDGWYILCCLHSQYYGDLCYIYFDLVLSIPLPLSLHYEYSGKPGSLLLSSRHGIRSTCSTSLVLTPPGGSNTWLTVTVLLLFRPAGLATASTQSGPSYQYPNLFESDAEAGADGHLLRHPFSSSWIPPFEQ